MEETRFSVESAIEEIQKVVNNGGPYGHYPSIADDYEGWIWDFWPGSMPWLPSQTGPAVDEILAKAGDLVDQFKEITGYDLRKDLLWGKYEAEHMDDAEMSIVPPAELVNGEGLPQY